MKIGKIAKDEMNDALNLVWSVFLKYEAPDYNEEGINEFKKTIEIKIGSKKEIFMGLTMKITKY